MEDVNGVVAAVSWVFFLELESAEVEGDRGRRTAVISRVTSVTESMDSAIGEVTEVEVETEAEAAAVEIVSLVVEAVVADESARAGMESGPTAANESAAEGVASESAVAVEDAVEVDASRSAEEG
jgi:hypothetical protein